VRARVGHSGPVEGVTGARDPPAGHGGIAGCDSGFGGALTSSGAVACGREDREGGGSNRNGRCEAMADRRGRWNGQSPGMEAGSRSNATVHRDPGAVVAEKGWPGRNEGKTS
jgi:hypothetical protein